MGARDWRTGDRLSALDSIERGANALASGEVAACLNGSAHARGRVQPAGRKHYFRLSSPDSIEAWDSLHHRRPGARARTGIWDAIHRRKEIEQLLSVELIAALLAEKFPLTESPNMGRHFSLRPARRISA